MEFDLKRRTEYFWNAFGPNGREIYFGMQRKEDVGRKIIQYPDTGELVHIQCIDIGFYPKIFLPKEERMKLLAVLYQFAQEAELPRPEIGDFGLELNIRWQGLKFQEFEGILNYIASTSILSPYFTEDLPNGGKNDYSTLRP